MRIASQNINNRGISLSKSKAIKAVTKYSKQFNTMCSRLYDLGYISSPYYYDERDFINVFNSEYPDVCSKFFNKHTGDFCLSSKVLEYLSKTTDDSDLLLVLQTIKSLKEAEQALEDYKVLFDKAKFQKKRDVVVCKPALGVSHFVGNANKLPLDSPYIWECFYLDADKKVIQLDFSFEIYKKLLSELGISLVGVTLDSDSLFLGGSFSVADDCYFLQELVDSSIKGDGKYASLLEETLEKYYSDYYENRTTKAVCSDYFSKIFLASIQDCIDYLKEERSKYAEYTEFYVTTTSLYLSVSSTEVEEKSFVDEIFVGDRLFEVEGKSLGVVNRLLGYSGLYIYEYGNTVYNYGVTGCTVPMVLLDKSNRKADIGCYPVQFATSDFNIISKTRGFKSDIMSYEQMLKDLDVESLDDIDIEASELVETGSPEFKLLVGRMVQTLLCIMCDYTLPDHLTPNQLKLDDFSSWLTEEVYLDACIEADILFNKLGF